MNRELWAPVVGYEGLYEVSNLGGLRSLPKMVRTKSACMAMRYGRVLRPYVDAKGCGYLCYNLMKDGKLTKFCIHALVIRAFVGPPPTPLHEVCHKDGCRTNAALSNLRYDTPAGNAADRVIHGTSGRGDKSPHRILTSEFVGWIRESRQSSRSLAPIFGVSPTTIRAVRTGQNWSHAA